MCVLISRRKNLTEPGECRPVDQLWPVGAWPVRRCLLAPRIPGPILSSWVTTFAVEIQKKRDENYNNSWLAPGAQAVGTNTQRRTKKKRKSLTQGRRSLFYFTRKRQIGSLSTCLAFCPGLSFSGTHRQRLPNCTHSWVVFSFTWKKKKSFFSYLSCIWPSYLPSGCWSLFLFIIFPPSSSASWPLGPFAHLLIEKPRGLFFFFVLTIIQHQRGL